MYTVKQLSTLAGVTPRTLHHYDQINLLKPESVGENGYRYYGEKSVLRLQQILFYRELGFSLESIRDVLGKPEFQILDALEDHRESLQGRMRRLERLIQTVDKTIHHLKGEDFMSAKGLFEGFSEEQQEEYDILLQARKERVKFFYESNRVQVGPKIVKKVEETPEED